MKRFRSMVQRGVALALAASMMSSAVLPTVYAAQSLNAENSVDELGNVDVTDEDGTLVYPEWDDDTADLPDEELPDDYWDDIDPELVPGDGSDIAEYGVLDGIAQKAAEKLVKAAEDAYNEVKNKNPQDVSTGDTLKISGLYESAKTAVDALKGSDKKTELQNRLKVIENGVKELEQQIAINAAAGLVKSAENAYNDVKNKDPKEVSTTDTAKISGLYESAVLAVDALPDSAQKDALRARLADIEEGVKYLEQQVLVNAAEKLVKVAEDAADSVTGTPSEADIAKVLAAYNAAKKAVDALDQNRDDVKELQARLEVVNQKLSKYEGQYVKAMIEDILEKLKNGELSKDELENLRDTLKALDKYIPESGDLRDLYDQTMGALDAAIEAVDLVNNVNALIQRLQQEIKDGHITQETIDQLQEVVKQAGDLIDDVKNNELLQGILKDLAQKVVDAAADAIKQAEAALKEAAARAAIEVVKKALEEGNLEKIDQAFKAADEAINALEPYMPDLAKTLRAQLNELRGKVYDKVLEDVQKILNDTDKSEQEKLDALKDYAKKLDEILKDYDGPEVSAVIAAVKADIANKALDALKEAIAKGDVEEINKAFDQAKDAIEQLEPYAPDVAKKLSDALEEIRTTYVNGLRDELEKALESGTWQEKLKNLKEITDRYGDLIKKIDVSGALKDLWETILNEKLTQLIADMANEINSIVNDKDMSALEKIAALNKLSDDLHSKLEDIVGKELADKMLKPFDDMIEKAKQTVANMVSAVGDALIKEVLKAIKKAVDSAESKEDAINKMETIYSDAHDLLTRMGMSDADADAKLATVRSVIDSIKKLLDYPYISIDTIKAAVDVIVDAVLNSDTIEGGLYDLVRAVLDGKDLDPAVKRALLEVVRDILKNADWTQLTPSLLDNVLDLAIDKVKEEIDKTYISSVSNIADKVIDELKPAIRDEIHRDVGQDTIDNVSKIFLDAIDNAIAGIDAGKNDEELMEGVRKDLLKLSPVVSDELHRIGAKVAGTVNSELSDRISAQLPGVILPDLIGDLIGSLAEKVVNEKIGDLDPTIDATIEKYVKYLTCLNHQRERVKISDVSCTTDEVWVDRCAKCGWEFNDTKEVTEKAWGHDPVIDEEVVPTDTDDGLTEGSHCARCGEVLTAQELLPAVDPQFDKWLVRADITADTVKETRYESQKKLDAAIDAALTKAGFKPENSERFLAQVQSSIGILPNERYPEEGITGMVKFPAKTEGKNCTFYAVQVLTADCGGHNAGDVIVTPLLVTKEGIALKVNAQSVVAIAWTVNE